MNKAPENILCIPRSEFEKRGVFQGFIDLQDENDLQEYLTEEPHLSFFVPRDEAEVNTKLKQLVPYCIFMVGKDIFCYSRNKHGGESRLHNKLSVGVGGHINDEDGDDPLNAYIIGLQRELEEEIGIQIPSQAIQGSIIGLVNDDENPVGRVHLGVVHVFTIAPQQAGLILANTEKSMSDACFTNIEDLSLENLESWSRYIVEYLVKKIQAPKPYELADVRERLSLLSISAANAASSLSTLLMQDNMRSWMMHKDNAEQALAQLTFILTGCQVHSDFSLKSIAEKSIAFGKQIHTITKHQRPASTQPES